MASKKFYNIGGRRWRRRERIQVSNVRQGFQDRTKPSAASQAPPRPERLLLRRVWPGVLHQDGPRCTPDADAFAVDAARGRGRIVVFLLRRLPDATAHPARPGEFSTVWPDWAIYWTLGNFLKPLATITWSKSPTFLGNFCKGVKIYHFSSELILGNFYRHLAIFFWSHWCSMT